MGAPGAPLRYAGPGRRATLASAMPIQLPSDLMVGVSGFRGRVGEALDPELATRLAAMYGTLLERGGANGPVLLGRDSRTSGPALLGAAAAGLVAVGRDVVDLGLVPTPTLMLAVGRSCAAGGIAVTASHNGVEWNAFKFAAAGGTFLPERGMDGFLRAIAAEDPPWARWDGLGRVSVDDGAVERHVEAILGLPHLDVEAIRSARIRVGLDCVHGAGGAIMPLLLERLGCEVRAMGTETDGRFPRDPEPTAENLEALGRLVRDAGARIGMAVDPDVDRLALTDERGRPLGEDLTLALAADVALRRRPGPVATNLSTSRVIDEVARARGCRVARAPVGEIHVVDAMVRERAVVGGEGNGGVILPALNLTRDAAVGAALVLQLLALEPDRPTSALVARLPSYRMVKEKVEFPRERLADAYDALEREWGPGRLDASDGARMDWPDDARWIHVRPSGTEPVVRLIAEAPRIEDARSLTRGARRVLARVAGR